MPCMLALVTVVCSVGPVVHLVDDSRRLLRADVGTQRQERPQQDGEAAALEQLCWVVFQTPALSANVPGTH